MGADFVIRKKTEYLDDIARHLGPHCITTLRVVLRHGFWHDLTGVLFQHVPTGVNNTTRCVMVGNVIVTRDENHE